MGVSVTVLGSSGGYSGAGSACSSFLVKNEEAILVLDMGSGALGNLLKYVGPDGIITIALSHLHIDHYSDLFGLLTARRFWEHPLPPLEVIAPSDAFDKLASPIAPKNREELRRLVNVRPFSDDIELPGFKMCAASGIHTCESWIMRIEAGGKIICYSGDTEICDNLIKMAEGADLFICDSTFTGDFKDPMKGHMSAVQAGQVALEAGVEHLLLTHLWPTLSRLGAEEEARGVFDGVIDMALEGMLIEL